MRVCLAAIATAALLAACSSNQSGVGPAAPALPASAEGAAERLGASPRHGEWVMVKTPAGDSVRAWLVYPEQRSKAPVVVVIHEIFGLSNWIRAVTDQLAANGFIAIAPDLLTRFNLPATATGEPNPDSARARIREIEPSVYHAQIRAVAEFALALPAAKRRYGITGFCWGGAAAFAHAVHYPDVDAAVSYYGTTPEGDDAYGRIEAPILGLYGENDARVNATIARAQAASKTQGFTFEPRIFAGAGHGFLRQQAGQNGANLRASEEAWPLTVEWFRKYLGK